VEKRPESRKGRETEEKTGLGRMSESENKTREKEKGAGGTVVWVRPERLKRHENHRTL